MYGIASFGSSFFVCVFLPFSYTLNRRKHIITVSDTEFKLHFIFSCFLLGRNISSIVECYRMHIFNLFHCWRALSIKIPTAQSSVCRWPLILYCVWCPHNVIVRSVSRDVRLCIQSRHTSLNLANSWRASSSVDAHIFFIICSSSSSSLSVYKVAPPLLPPIQLS